MQPLLVCCCFISNFSDSFRPGTLGLLGVLNTLNVCFYDRWEKKRLPWGQHQTFGIHPTKCNVASCKLYQHLLRGFSAASARRSCSHSSYTPRCLHLMPPICPEPSIHSFIHSVRGAEQMFSRRRSHGDAGNKYMCTCGLNSPLGLGQEGTRFVLRADGSGERCCFQPTRDVEL